ncbi:M24 family metallopeptidase [bacterium]|nr:M24 family metallopeptidase [bacterium]
MKIKLTDIQNAIRQLGFDGWLMYSFRKNNPIVDRILDLPSHLVLMRRYYYYIPANGTPQKLVHSIERGSLDSVPGDKTVFSSWQELETGLKKITGGAKKVAMEYSHECAIPYVSIVDAGTVEMVRKATGAEIVSSADLVQIFDATWDNEQWQMHQEAGKGLIETVHEAFAFIKENIRAGKKLTEFDVQNFMLQCFEKRNIYSSSAPNCSVNENSGDPHYEPTETIFKEIKKDDFVLIDLWAKKKAPRSVYADYAWVGYVGETVPEKYEKIFQVVKGARDAAVDFLKKNLKSGQPVYGWQVDDASRQYIVSKGYGEYFIHRTGHSIGEEVHGNGANMDNMETKDIRRILPRTCFSIEPGIYFYNDFGIRSEIDAYITENNDVVVTGAPMQESVIPILK